MMNNKKLKKILLTAVSSLFIASVSVLSAQSSVYAAEFKIGDDFPGNNSMNGVYYLNGDIKALVVRIGFADHPADRTNPVYNRLNDEYLRSVYEGKKGGVGLPFNGLSDYLYTSSYGKLNMSLGEIIDIQMDGPIEDYISDKDGTLLIQLTGGEFYDKLTSQVNFSDYDANGDKAIDALYIWNLTGEALERRAGYYKEVYGPKYNGYYTVISLSHSLLENDERLMNVVVHETGHILGADDYYFLDTYPVQYNRFRSDIGNIMGVATLTEKGDYFAWIKWIQKWITKDNVTGIEPSYGESGTAKLTPYDSDTDAGKKIILFKISDGYIAADYSGGINNNAYDTDLRKTGFRFYKLDNDGNVCEIYHGYDRDPKTGEVTGTYQLFADGDEIDDLLYENEIVKFKITNIKTGAHPSFTYSYTLEGHDIYPEKVSLNKTLLVLDKGKTGKLTATVAPADAKDKTVTWSSSNTNVAVVDASGNVKAINYGTAKITAKTVNGKLAECEVRVNGDTFTGVRKESGQLKRFKSGAVDTAYTGLDKYPEDGKWYYFAKGVHDPSFTGVAQRTDGKWLYVKNGVFDNTFTGVARNTNKKWVFVKKGVFNTSFTGVARNTLGNWVFVKKGCYYAKYTGVAKSTSGNRVYVIKGKFSDKAKKSTGVAKSTSGKYVFVRKGRFDPSYTGLTKSLKTGKIVYVTKGYLDTKYNGKAKYKGQVYTVKKGMAVMN